MKIFMTLLVGAGLSTACKFHTIPNPQKPAEKKLQNDWQFPLERDAKNFGLVNSSGKDSRVYSPATMLIFNENMDSNDLIPVLDATDDFRQTQADYLNTYWHGEKKDYEDTIRKLRAEIKTLTSAKNQAMAEDLNKSRTERELTAKTWLTDILTNEIKDESTRKARLETFHGYCEAKIWELATNKVFNRRKYREMPSPMPICEGYYQAENSPFFKGDSCKPAQDQQTGKDYTACLWQEGLLKTRWFQSEGSLAGEFVDQKGQVHSRVDLLFSLAELPEFRRMFARDIYDIETGHGVVGSSFGSTSSDKFKFILKLGKARCSTNPTKINSKGQKVKVSSYAAITDLCQIFKTATKIKTPEDFILQVQWTDTKKIDGFDIPREVAIEGQLDWEDNFGNPQTEDLANLMEYNNLIRYFGQRTWLGRSEFDKDFHIAPLGNTDLDEYGNPLPNPSAAKKKLGGVHGAVIYRSQEVADHYKTKSSLKPLYPTPNPDLLAQIESFNRAIMELDTEIPQWETKIQDTMSTAPLAADAAKTRASERTWSPYRPSDSPEASDIWSETLRKSSGEACLALFEKEYFDLRSKGYATPIARSSVELSLRVTKEEDELKMEIWLGDRSTEFDKSHIVACASISTGVHQPCQEAEGATTFATAPAQSFTYDKITGRMSIRFAADIADPDPKAKGKLFLAKTSMAQQFCQHDTYFQTIPEENLKGRSIEIEMYPDVQDTYLHLLTGKVMVRGPGHIEGGIRFEHEGAMSAIYSDQRTQSL